MATNNKTIMLVGAVVSAIALFLARYKNTIMDKLGFLSYNEKIDKVLSQIFKNEGGYINNPADAGGETNYGISKRYHPSEDIKNMTKERAKEIYNEEYIKPFESILQYLNLQMCYQVIDSAVNCGVSRTKQLLSKVDLYTDFRDIRKDYYRSIAVGKNEQFLKGWLKRVDVVI